MTKEFFLYARKSTDTEEKQILSIEAQLAELKLFAEREDIYIKEILTESMTAKEPGRPVFNAMINRLERGEACGILAWHPDRLARNSVDGGRIIYLLDLNKIQYLKFPQFWFENTPQGKFMLNISFGQSKYFVDNLSENVARGMRQKIRRGEWPGWAPPGYLNDPVSRKVIPDPSNSKLIQKLFKLYATGNYAVKNLRKTTYEWGLKNRRGNPMCTSTLFAILSNPFYIGLMRYKGELFQGAHEPLVSKEVFDQVREALECNGKPLKNRKHHFPFLGLATCSFCGGMITAEKQKGHHYYRCTKKKGNCTEPYIREEALAQQISQAILSVSLSKEGYDYMINELNKEAKESALPIIQAKLESAHKIKELQCKLDRLLDAHLEGLIEKSEYQAKKEILLQEKLKIEERIKTLEAGALSWLEPCREFLKSAHSAEELAIGGNLEAKRNFIKKTGSNHRLGLKKFQFDFQLPWAYLGGKSFSFNSKASLKACPSDTHFPPPPPQIHEALPPPRNFFHNWCPGPESNQGSNQKSKS